MKRIIGMGVLLGILLFVTGCFKDEQPVQQKESKAEEHTGTKETAVCEKTAENIAAGTTEYTYFVEDRQLKISATYAEPVWNQDGIVVIEGLDNTYTATALPFQSIKLALPKDRNVVSLTAKWGEAKIKENVELSEKEYAAADTDIQTTPLLSKDDTGRRTSVSIQELEGVKIAYVNIYPVVYNAETKTLIYTDTMEVTLQLEEDAWDLSHLEDVDYIKEMIDNPEMLDDIE